MVEIRAAEGGEDSRLFSADLCKGYIKFCTRKGLGVDLVSQSDSSFGLKVWGSGAEVFLKESGKHCIQRVPPTETRGRRQTSFVTVSVTQFQEEVRITLNMSEIKVTDENGGGSGGQNQNRHYCAIRAVHLPTGITVFINGKDQFQNRKTALAVLQARLEEKSLKEARESRRSAIKDQIGDGSRGGKSRTWDFIRGQVTDHQTGTKSSKIDRILKGELELLQ